MSSILKFVGLSGVLLLGLPVLEMLYQPDLPDGLYALTSSLGMGMLGVWAAGAR